ncbi:hypothetical protein [Candidatus Poriferisodalis sp.]|uniref:hypothetical protein n=1 Tax=Candidatus Poriferisodalis sp. TaxID=3101277 RepID=UPI003B51F9E9
MGEVSPQSGPARLNAAKPQGSLDSVTTAAYPQAPPSENVLPFPWADFNEMWDPRPFTDSDLMFGTGTLHIEDNCLYIVVENEIHYDPRHEEPRYVLVLPRNWVQVNPTTNELWIHGVHESYGARWGPIAMGERVEIGNQPRTQRSEKCDNSYLWFSSYILPCIKHFDPGRILCPVEEYAREYGVSRSEAERRITRLPELEEILAGLRAAEQERLGGWGIDHDRSLVAWIWLVGDEPPSAAAQMLAARHADVEVRSGATTSYAALKAAQQSFAEGRSTYLPNGTLGGTVERFELSGAVAGTWIDHRSNLLEIEVDTRWIPYEVASVLLTGDSGSYDDDRWPPQDELYGKIAEELQEHIDVPFSVVYGWLDHSDR